MTRAAQGLRLGVLLPCRNEAAVIERKLRNLAQVNWPGGDGSRHVIALVDDGSEDGTAQQARAVWAELRASLAQPQASPRAGDSASGLGAAGLPELRLLTNDQAPGKAGAMRTGIEALEAAPGPPVELVVLSDADVVMRRDALVVLAAAFEHDAGERALGLACGAQEFVRSLGQDGRPLDAGGVEPAPAAGLYDRITDGVRAFESRRGCLFSLHGQLAAWPAASGLRPTAGVAADDLDLMLQVRARGERVERIEGARFLEVKPQAGASRNQQALRRARAYFQVLDRHPELPAQGLFQRVQTFCYRTLPAAAPWLGLAGALLVVALAGWLGAERGALGATLVVGLLAAVGPGRRLVRLLRVIATARRLERGATLSDRWEMQRG